MKAILQFNLPEDAEEFRRASKATDLCGAIFEMQEYLMFRHVEVLPDAEEIRKRFCEILDEHNIKLDELYS